MNSRQAPRHERDDSVPDQFDIQTAENEYANIEFFKSNFSDWLTMRTYRSFIFMEKKSKNLAKAIGYTEGKRRSVIELMLGAKPKGQTDCKRASLALGVLSNWHPEREKE